MKHDTLMIPGPVGVRPEVLAEMATPMQPHYGDEWVAIYRETVDLIKQIFATESDLYLMAGPGTVALEAALCSLIGHGGRAVVLSNGPFGERMADMVAAYTADVDILRRPYGLPLDAQVLADHLRDRPGVDVVVAVHCETSAGLLNPLEEIAAVTRSAGCLSIVDAVSSLGGARLPVDRWGVDVCVASANKCLEAPPGMAAISVSPRAVERLQEPRPRRGWYVDLRTWRRYEETAGDWHPYPMTMPVNNVLALRCAARLILAEGLPARFERHAQAALAVREGLRGLGFELVAPESCASPTVTAARPPAGIAVAHLLAELARRYGIRIADGIGEHRGHMIRVGHMGPAADPELIGRLLDALAEIMQRPEAAGSGG